MSRYYEEAAFSHGKFLAAKPEKPGLKDHLKGVEAKNAQLRRELEDARKEWGREKDRADTMKGAYDNTVKRASGLSAEVKRLQDEIENRIAFGVDAKDSLGKEIQRLQVQLGQQKSYTQSLGEARLRVANERDALRAEVERLRGDLERVGCERVQLERDYSSAILLKAYVAETLGLSTVLCSWDSLREELKAKLSQLTIQAKGAAEFRAAWAKLKGMLE